MIMPKAALKRHAGQQMLNCLVFSWATAAVLLRCTKVTKNNAHFCVHTLMLMILISNGFVWLSNYFILLLLLCQLLKVLVISAFATEVLNFNLMQITSVLL